MIDIVEVASIVMLAYGLGARPYIESIKQFRLYECNFSQVCTGIGRSTHSVGTSIDYGSRQIMRSDRSV